MTCASRDFVIIVGGGDIYELTTWLLHVLDGIEDPAIYDTQRQDSYRWNVYRQKQSNYLSFLLHLDWIDGKPIPMLPNDKLMDSISIHKLNSSCHIDVYSISKELMQATVKEIIEPYVDTKWVKLIQGEWLNVVCSSNVIS